MTTLTLATAKTLVRKNLDEAGLNESLMYTDENNDNLSLDDLIAKFLPEAINEIHLLAPATSLEGIPYVFSSGVRPEGESVSRVGDTLIFSPSSASDYLRLVAFQAIDSDIVVTDVLAEASPEGRKQLNPYVRGRHDRPRLVRTQGTATPPEFRYYSLKTDTSVEPRNAIRRFSFVREQRYSPAATGYEISRPLRQNIIDRLTAMVMETYGNQNTQSYYQRSVSF